MHVYCSLPLRITSRAWGWLAQCNVPEVLRPTIYGLYATAFGVKMEEAVVPDLKYAKFILLMLTEC